MKTVHPSKPTEINATLLAAGLIALCCGGPFLLAALVATGLGAWFLSQGALPLAAVAVLAGAGLVLLWLQRSGGIAPAGRSAACCAPPEIAKREKS